MQDIPYDVSHVPIDYDEFVNVKEISNKISRKDERRERREQRAALERDVSQLRQQLIIEINMRNALNRGLSRPLGSLPRIYGSLPVETRDLLLEVAVLEEEIVSLEKQVVHLGREIEIGAMPATDKETIWPNPNQNISPESVEILNSPLISPKDSARLKPKPWLSPGKSTDQKSKPSKVSLPAGKVTENNSSSIKTVSIPSRKSADIGSFVKSSLPPKDSSQPRRTSTLVPPQKPQLQRSSSLPKVPVRNTGDLKSKRRLSLTKREPQGTTLSPAHAVPFIPLNIISSKDEVGAPPSSAAPVSPSDQGRSCTQPPRIKTENGKPPMTRNVRSKRKDAPMARVVKAPSTPRQPEQQKALTHTSRLPRQPVTHDPISTRRTSKPSTAAFEQKMSIKKTPLLPNSRRPFHCDSSLQKPADAGKDDTNNELDGDYKLIHLSPDVAKISQPNCSPERDSKLGLEKEADSVLLSEEVVKLLKTIYGNMQERQPFLASEFDTSSHSSISTSFSGASPDDYEMRGGVNINIRLSDCYTGSFLNKRRVSMKYMRDCGEVADALDSYTYLNTGNISSRTDFHQRLMS